MSKLKPPSRDTQIKSLIDCGRQFYDRRWMWGTAGNLSVKLKHEPLEIAITPSGINKGHMKPEEIMVIKSQSIGKPSPHPNPLPLRGRGSKGEGAGRMPSAETVIHQTIHETLPGCGAVFHVHPVYSTLISSLYGHPKQRQMLRVDWFEMMKGVGVGEEESGEIPIFPNWQDVSLIARDVKQYLMENPKALPVALIYNHGLTGWGRTVEQARNHLEILEYVCEYLYLKRLLKAQ
jgi:methylthioribose-1-phosphate isomerase